MADLNLKNSKLPIPFIAGGIYLALLVVFFVVSFKVMGIPIAAVGIFIVLECVLAALLDKIPLWVHGLVFIGQIVAGAFFGKVAFMLLMALVYAGAICMLFLFTRDYE
ncbi:MAG: hypothetical protein K6F30_00465 [Lachnospiraceae bacterium]|nr:hypothetical protein [Lachnospiraceae bacterium]